MSGPKSIAPSVGIFWGVPDGQRTVTLATDATPRETAEAYGDFLTHPGGHYEVWEAWRRLGSAGLARRGLPAMIGSHEYEEFPRGRIVYDTRNHMFVIYADHKLQAPATVARIVAAFGLGGEHFTVRSDAHYRS